MLAMHLLRIVVRPSMPAKVSPTPVRVRSRRR